MGEGKMQSVSFQDQPAVADDDEATERPTAVAEKEQPQVKLPWRQWRSGIGSSMGDTEDDKSAAVAVLNSFHGNFAVAILAQTILVNCLGVPLVTCLLIEAVTLL